MNTYPMNETVSIESGGPELLDRIEPMWIALRNHHAELAPIWRDSLLATTFESRKAGLLKKAESGLLVLLAVSQQPVGYCVCTLCGEGEGEVDSLFVVPHYRRRGIGRALMVQALAWL